MRRPRIAIVSFPGNNCEVESMRHVREAGMEPLFFRWNDDRAKLREVDGYFLPGGFAYEDRGRSGMVAGRDPVLEFIGREAESGKVVIGNCNGAQVLVESGLIPLGQGLQMSLARNAIRQGDHFVSPGFLSEWVWMTPACGPDRCATSHWTGAMHVPIAHGEGRFTTRDKDLYEELRKNDQIAFKYCDEAGKVSEDPVITPNGSAFAIAGICNPAGNVVAIMPHPERTEGGRPYFESVREWITGRKQRNQKIQKTVVQSEQIQLPVRASRMTEIFIETIIVNNEERTVEQTARMYVPELRLKQWKYLSVPDANVQAVLKDLTVFNGKKERAFIRRKGSVSHWNADRKTEEPATSALSDLLLLRRDIPDTGAGSFGEGSETGICYGINEIDEQKISSSKVLEVFSNPHASTLQKIL